MQRIGPAQITPAARDPIVACLVHLVSHIRAMPASSARSARRAHSSRAISSVVNVHAAKTHLSRLLKRVERGERITIARDGKPVAVIGPVPAAQRPPLPPDDPLLNLGKFAVAGPAGKLTNVDIDRLLYGPP